MVMRLLAAPGLGDVDLANLKAIVYGGAPMYLADCLAAIDAFGPRLFNLFGQGESPMTITGLGKSRDSGGSVHELSQLETREFSAICARLES